MCSSVIPVERKHHMKFLEEVPAIRQIETDRANLLAIDIVGHVSAADAENLFGLLEAAYALHSRIDVLLRLIDHEGVDWSAIAADTLDQGRADAIAHIGRCATVGEPDWTAEAQAWFESAPPVEIRHFDAEEEAAAWHWLQARPLGEFKSLTASQ